MWYWRGQSTRYPEIRERPLTTSLVSPVILASYTGMIVFVPVSFFWLSSEKWPWDNSLFRVETRKLQAEKLLPTLFSSRQS